MKLNAILLASGSARRFGENKLLYEVEGLPLYERAVRAADVEGVSRLLVVTRYSEIEEALRDRRPKNGARLEILHNPDAGEGLSASVRLGVTASPEADAFLFVVCDQPYLNPESVARLIRAYREASGGIACLAHGRRTGNPVIFSRAYAGELLALSGDTGGKAVLRRHEKEVRYVQAAARELIDLDKKTEGEA